MAITAVVGSLACALGVWTLTDTAEAKSISAARHHKQNLLQRLLGAVPELYFAQLLLNNERMSLVTDEFRVRLRREGVYLSRARVASVVLMLAVLGALGIAVLAQSAVFFLVGCAAAYSVLVVSAQLITKKHNAELMREMPEILRSLSSALGAGQTLTQAVGYVADHTTGRSAEAFRQCAFDIQCGATAQDALTKLGTTFSAPGMEMLTSALVISQRTGSPLKGLLSRSAQLIEEQAELTQLLNTKTAQVRFSVRIVCLMPLVMLLLLGMLSPEFREGLSHTSGMLCVAVAACLDIIAILIVRLLMRGIDV